MDGKIYVYDHDSAGTLTLVTTLSQDSMRSGVRVLAQHRDAVFAGAEDGSVTKWSLLDHTVQGMAAVHGKIVSALCSVGQLVRWLAGWIWQMLRLLCCISPAPCRNVPAV